MAEKDDQIVVARSSATTVELYPARPFKMYTVIEHEIASLATATDEEAVASAFFFGSFGLFGGGAFGWLASGPLTPTVAASYAAALVVLGISSLWFGVKWFRTRRSRREMLQTIRVNEALPTRLKLSIDDGPPRAS